MLLKASGAAAVKLEGGEAMAATVEFLIQRGIPVMGHVGLTPQAVNVLGGYGARGRGEPEANKIVRDARTLASAGAFAIVVEGVIEQIAEEVTRAVPCPTIGIGASAQCDGQVLVPRHARNVEVARFGSATRPRDAISGAAEAMRTPCVAGLPEQSKTYQAYDTHAKIIDFDSVQFRVPGLGLGTAL